MYDAPDKRLRALTRAPRRLPRGFLHLLGVRVYWVAAAQPAQASELFRWTAEGNNVSAIIVHLI